MSPPVVFSAVAGGPFPFQAVVLHRTLRQALPDARLSVICPSEPAARALAELGVAATHAGELERRDPRLVRTRAGRSHREYCLTLKAPFALELLEEAPAGTIVTAVDADIAFLSDPAPLYAELAEASVGIVDHRFAERFRSRARWAGRFNSSWVSFRRDTYGLEALRWWRERVLEWCGDRAENGRYGDQGYLQDWPRRFARVHVLQHPGAAVAPWTDNRTLARNRGGVYVGGEPVICFHAQSLRLHRLTRGTRPLPRVPEVGWRLDPGYRPSSAEWELLWDPYLEMLGQATRDLLEIDRRLLSLLRPLGPRDRARGLARRLWMRRQAAAMRFSAVRSG